MNILAFMAHPEDAALFCAGTLMKYRQQGHEIYIAVATGKEAPWGAVEMGAQVRLLGFDPAALQDNMTTRAAALTAIRWANADIILTHPIWDADGNHAIAGKLIADSLLIVGGKLHPADLPPIQKLPHLFYIDTMAGSTLQNQYGMRNYKTCDQTFYLTPGVHSNDWFEPEVYVDISQYAQQKFAWISDPVLREGIQAQSRIRGLQMGTRYAEAFTGHRIVGHIADYRLLP